jgi:hypothetical protein
MKLFRLVAVAAALALLLPAGALAGGGVGEEATDFVCFDETGATRNLHEFWGQIIVLNFAAGW